MRLLQPVFKNDILNGLLGFMIYVLLVPSTSTYLPLVFGYHGSPKALVYASLAAGVIIYMVAMGSAEGERGYHRISVYVACVVSVVFVQVKLFTQTGSDIKQVKSRTAFTYIDDKPESLTKDYKYTYTNILGNIAESDWTTNEDGAILLYTK